MCTCSPKLGAELGISCIAREWDKQYVYKLFCKAGAGWGKWGWDLLAMVNPRGGVACGACGRWWIACHDRWLYRRAGIHSTVLCLTCPSILFMIKKKCLFIFYVVHLLTSWFIFYLACQANKNWSTDLLDCSFLKCLNCLGTLVGLMVWFLATPIPGQLSKCHWTRHCTLNVYYYYYEHNIHV